MANKSSPVITMQQWVEASHAIDSIGLYITQNVQKTLINRLWGSNI